MPFERCSLCYRNCKVNRSDGNVGFCKETDTIRLARAALHFWEEPCISRTCGSGAVFFTGCSLGCIFCQNFQISDSSVGKEVSVSTLSDIFLHLQEQGAANINLVTPTHFVPQIIRALDLARSHGLTLPIVYNTGTYDSLSTLRMLEGYVDIYLPDCKFASPSLSGALCHATDYYERAMEGIREMVRQTGPCVFDPASSNIPVPDDADLSFYSEHTAMKKGVIVRHLVLPGQLEDSCHILSDLHMQFQDQIFISIMNQYTPMKDFTSDPSLDPKLAAALSRKLTTYEYDKVLSYAEKIGITNAFIQAGHTAKESYIPAFDYEGLPE
ncbi:MAG: radical SAM protein [Lachnospiraceae bacterium]|nr:radical SAM protein [Lachnospiraceae bacterium]